MTTSLLAKPVPVMKKCAGCGRELALTEFNKDRSKKDGHQDRCRECFSRYNRERYLRNKEKIKRMAKEYRQANPRKVFETRLKTFSKNPSEKRLRRVVDAALKCGELVNPGVCSGCGCTSEERRIEAHHYDYAKPLDVIWVCTPCHRQLDARRRIHEGKLPYGDGNGTNVLDLFSAKDLPTPTCTPAELAKAVGVSPQTIRKELQLGHIPSRKIGRKWLVATNQLQGECE